MDRNKDKKEVQAMMEDCKNTKLEKVHSGFHGSKNKAHLPCPVHMDEVLEAFFYL